MVLYLFINYPDTFIPESSSGILLGRHFARIGLKRFSAFFKVFFGNAACGLRKLHFGAIITDVHFRAARCWADESMIRA